MKKIFFVLFLSLIATNIITAAVMSKPITPHCVVSIQDASFASMMNMLATGLKPTSFTKDWKSKSGAFLSKIRTLDPKDLSGSASTLFEFAKFLKPNVFEDSWKTQKGDFLRGVSQVNSTQDLSKLFSLLLNNISPKSYTKEFKSKADGLKVAAGKLGQ